MKINSIRVSNILSFEHQDNIDQCQEIKFGDGLNIIIGPNGAGKSNFLEIVNQLFNNALFFGCQYVEDHIIAKKNNKPNVNLQETLKPTNRAHGLVKNHHSDTEKKQIQIDIGLSETDKDNLVFIQQNLEEITKLFKKYAVGHPQFPTSVTTEELKQINSVTLLFEDSGNTAKLANMTNQVNETITFVLLYLQNFNFLQYIILIANTEDGKNWKPLNNTFSMISSYRNYNALSQNFTVQQSENNAVAQIKTDMQNEKFLHAENKEPIVFTYVKHKIGYAFHNMLIEHGYDEKKDQAEEITEPTYVKINDILKKTLGLKLHVTKQHQNTLEYPFDFLDEKTGEKISIQELSGGEKGILHFILSIFGYDLENGVMIIDEPEIHIHPQMQQQYLEMMLESVQHMTMQIIAVTHSPEFVNSKTIDGCLRFYRDKDGYTKVLVPKLDNRERDLVRILDYTKATRVLFSNKVVLVEGDSDAYFYRFYYDQYKKNEDELPTLEFQYMMSKDYYSDWKKFFNDWQIETHFIRDKDDFGGTNSDIEKKYGEGIYILKKGKLEDYIGNKKSNKLENAIDFCKSRFNDWKDNPDYKEKIEELNQIFDKIVGKC